MSRWEVWVALALMAAWFGLTLAIAWPLAEAPVVDSWVYRYAVEALLAGRLAFPGFTQVSPVALAAYGALWSRIFGASYVTLDLSLVLVGAIGGVLVYLLARQCRASAGPALFASGLLVFNPCYLFLSFSFMSDVPFVVMILAGLAAFATAETKGGLWPWLCGPLLIVAFLIRPFAMGTIAGCLGAALLIAPGSGQRARRLVLPLLIALVLCALLAVGLNRALPRPWMLAIHEQRLRYLGLVSAWHYLVAGILGPAMYIGLVLSPMALSQLFSARWRLGLAIAAGLFGLTAAGLASPGSGAIPELSCCGGWDNALVLRGAANHFVWTSPGLHWLALVLGALGAAGLILAALATVKPTRTLVATLLSAAIYWAAIVPLWFYNDRYYLVLLPAGCLLMAAAPSVPNRSWLAVGLRRACAGLLMVILGWMAVGGVYAQQRGLQAVAAARDSLLAAGIPRPEIDAGYPLNGADLYRRPAPGQIETPRLEAGIPMLTSNALDKYMIASRILPGTVVLRRLSWPGPWGWGRRYIWVLKHADGSREARRGLDGFSIPTRFPPLGLRYALNLLGMLAVAGLPILMTMVFTLGKCRSPAAAWFSRWWRPPRWCGPQK